MGARHMVQGSITITSPNESKQRNDPTWDPMPARATVSTMEHDALFEQLAIRVPRRRVAQYFYGDNIEGYFEGHTYRYAQGAGYCLYGRSLFRDFLSWRGRRLNDRIRAERAMIYPYGVRHQHGPSWWDELMLLRRRHAVALRNFSRKPQRLAVAPILDLHPRHVLVQRRDGGYIVFDKRKTFCLGLSSSQPFEHTETLEHDGRAAPVFRTLQEESEFTLYSAFARRPRRALEQAMRLRTEDGVRQHKLGLQHLLTRSHLWTDDETYNRALSWAKLSSYFLVEDEFGKGIWAGLPWFKNTWSRDTFIALPGTLLVNGLFDDAREVIRNFAHWQNTDKKSPDYGRVPNRVTGTRDADMIFNTTDGTPWLIREIYEYLCYTGDTAFAEEMYPFVKNALTGAIKCFCDRKGFLTHDDADTWMDARIQHRAPWSARGSRANDVQALWFTALQIGALLAKRNRDSRSAKAWTALAAKLKKNFTKMFWDPGRNVLADRMREDDTRDIKARPNQLMVITIPLLDPLIDPATEKRIVSKAVGALLFPYGITSLSQKDPYFHPYHHRDDVYHHDAAYHNGTIWGWNAGFTVTALCRTGQTEMAWTLTKNLAGQILNKGCRGAMSELVDAMPDAKGRITPSGTWAQAWSTSEFTRNGYQDFGGFRPRLLDNRIELSPHIPRDVEHLTASFPFGRGSVLSLAYSFEHGKEVYVICTEGGHEPLTIQCTISGRSAVFHVEQGLASTDSLTLVISGRAATVAVNGQWAARPLKGSVPAKVKPLSFAKPNVKAKFKTLGKKDHLQQIIEAGKYR